MASYCIIESGYSVLVNVSRKSAYNFYALLIIFIKYFVRSYKSFLVFQKVAMTRAQVKRTNNIAHNLYVPITFINIANKYGVHRRKTFQNV